MTWAPTRLRAPYAGRSRVAAALVGVALLAVAGCSSGTPPGGIGDAGLCDSEPWD